MREISQRVVLITGASSGIGKAVAEHLHECGYQVFGTQHQTQVSDSPVPMIPMDVDNEKSVQQGIRAVCEQAGRLDAVINNAGWLLMGAVEDTSIAEARDQLETNLLGVLRVCKACLPHLRQAGGGYIINISSLGGVQGLPFCGMYCASKFALEGLSESLWLETRLFGVRVSIIEAGDFHTQMSARRRIVAAAGRNSAYARAYNRFVQGTAKDEERAPTPEPVARLVESILLERSPRLRYVVGMRRQTILVPLKRFLPQALYERLVLRAMQME